jgi:hypothetical protein
LLLPLLSAVSLLLWWCPLLFVVLLLSRWGLQTWWGRDSTLLLLRDRYNIHVPKLAMLGCIRYGDRTCNLCLCKVGK